MNSAKQIVAYILKKLDFVYQIYARFEDNLQCQVDDIANGGLPNETFSKEYHHLEYISANLFRQAMLIMVCSYLEEAMDLIGNISISDYSAKLKEISHGSWFKKRERIFKLAGVSFEAIQDDCKRVNDLLQVRNCIVHAGGYVDKFRYTKALEYSIELLKERDKDKNLNLVEIMSDRFLYLGDNVVPHAILASENIINQCADACA